MGNVLWQINYIIESFKLRNQLIECNNQDEN